jgi:putative tricarboxylic transport membrane protein
MKFKLEKWITLFVLLTVILSGCAAPAANKDAVSLPKAAQQLDWPKKPVTILVWSAPGSGVDVMGRQAAKLLEKKLGQPVVVENKTGGDGTAAMQSILSKPADGYTVGINTRSQMFSLNLDLKDQFKLADFDFIATNEGDPYALVVPAGSGIETLDAFVKKAKSNDKFAIGGFGANSAHNIFAKDLGKAAGFPFQWIPYNGGSEAVTQLLGGHIQAALTNVGQVLEQIKAGKLKIVAISTSKRMPELPDTPTFNELGYPNLDSSHWRGFYLKAGTPKEIVSKYDQLFKELSQDPEWQQYLKANGLTNDFVSSGENGPFVKKEYETIAKKLAEK